MDVDFSRTGLSDKLDVDFSRIVENNLNFVPDVVGLEAPAVDLEDEAVCFNTAETGFKAVASNPEAEPVDLVAVGADFILEAVNLGVCKFGLVVGVASDDCFVRAIFSNGDLCFATTRPTLEA